MSKFRYLAEDEMEHLPPEPGESEVILLEIAHQLRRIADMMEPQQGKQ